MLAHEWFQIAERPREDVDVVGITDIAEYHSRIAPQAAQLGAFRGLTVGSPPARSFEKQIGRNPELVTQGADLLDG
jgi:hypothetical protein